MKASRNIIAVRNLLVRPSLVPAVDDVDGDIVELSNGCRCSKDRTKLRTSLNE